MHSHSFNLSLLSTYRTHLMGIATIMIIICHANVYQIEIPSALSKLFIYGNYGVDIFLLLSGLGCYYSLSRKKNAQLGEWYKKRFKRIFIPYLLIQFPFWLLSLIVGEFELIDQLYLFSTLKYWTCHMGAWYIALLIPIYLSTPFIYKFLKTGNKRFLKCAALCILISFLCSFDFRTENTGFLNDLIDNVQWAFNRSISFIIGLYIAPLVESKKNTNIYLLIGTFLILYILIHSIFPNLTFAWLLVIPITVSLCLILEQLKTLNTINSSLLFLGTISLESYLSNIYLSKWVKYFANTQNIDCPVLHGKYVEYLCVILFGIILAVCINKISQKVITCKI